MRTYDFSTAATGIVQGAGNFLRYQSGSAGGDDSGIILRPEGGGSAIELTPGEWVTLPRVANAFHIAARKSGVVVNGKLIIGEGTSGTASVAGTVEVIDGGRARTLAGQAFSAAISNVANASQWANVQLWNPLTSQKTLVVKRILCRGDAAGVSQYRAVFTTSQQTGLLTANCSNKNPLSTVVTSAQTRTWSLAPPGVNNGVTGVFWAATIQIGQSLQAEFNEPLIVPPGWGLNVQNDLAAGFCGATFDFIEQ
jgi:hypothetical protein